MKTFMQIVEETSKTITEIMPWDLEEKLDSDTPPMLVDIREPYEFDAMHIQGSISAPRGILETACEFNYEETIPALASAREADIVLICRSGNRSVLTTAVLQQLGYQRVSSLKTGLRGWNDYEQPMVNNNNDVVDIDIADDYFAVKIRPDQEA